MFLRALVKSKEKLFILVILSSLVASLLYIHHLQEYCKHIQWSGERCMSELSSLKYQLNVVTEYKDRIDKLLTDSQKAHKSDKDMFKDVVESCVAMKQQSTICQSQFEDLQSECKKVREDYNKLLKDHEKTKTTRQLGTLRS